MTSVLRGVTVETKAAHHRDITNCMIAHLSICVSQRSFVVLFRCRHAAEKWLSHIECIELQQEATLNQSNGWHHPLDFRLPVLFYQLLHFVSSLFSLECTEGINKFGKQAAQKTNWPRPLTYALPSTLRNFSVAITMDLLCVWVWRAFYQHTLFSLASSFWYSTVPQWEYNRQTNKMKEQ